MEFEKKDLKKSLIPTEVEGNQLGVGALENGTYLNCFKSVENKTVLLIVCCLFGAFAISEMVGAVVSHICFFNDPCFRLQ